jgi:hypothetical protein
LDEDSFIDRWIGKEEERRGDERRERIGGFVGKRR